MPEPTGLSWSVISSMEIMADGQNITTHCDIKRSVFEMHAGPLAGTAKVYVRDLGHDLTIATGSEITLDIENLRVWGGYVMSITREYAFPVDDTSDPAETPRYFVLDCSDYNILFSKRFIRNKANPTKRVPKYAAGRHDDEIVLDLFHNYLDLEGDGLTHTKVTYVGTPQEDNPGSPAVPAMSWAKAMTNTALLPGAIYYIDADKDLAYADVDVADAPFVLSDEPNLTTSFGYRDMAIIEDGTMLANDAFVWGTGLGQDKMTFKRYQVAGSQTDHGLWQWSDYRQDLYKPQSVLKRATTYVDGSTQNNRGHKDPAITIRCTTIKPGLRAGMKVHFVCGIHGYDDIIPIRSMHISFVNNTEAVYQLVLAHYLDEAWNTAEFPPLMDDPKIDTRHCEEPVCGPGGITDTFTRTYGSPTTYPTSPWSPQDIGWDTTEVDGVTWGYYRQGTSWVDGSRGGLGYVPNGYPTQGQGGNVFLSDTGLFGDFNALFSVQWERSQGTKLNQVITTFSGGWVKFNQGTVNSVELKRFGKRTDAYDWINRNWGTSKHWVRIHVDDSGALLKIWVDGNEEPEFWTLAVVLSGLPYGGNAIHIGFELVPTNPANLPEGDNKFYVDDLDIEGLNSAVCVVTHPYAPGSLTATTVDGGSVAITEVDPAAGTFTYVTDPPGADIIVCYLEYGTDTPPGGYGGGPVYRPRHVRQLGWGTPLDGSNCTMASACIALDRHTMGVETSTPPHMRSLQDDQTGGTDLNDAAVAWVRGWGEYLDVHYGDSWSSFVSMVNSGRGAILQGKYSRITNQYSAQPSFDGSHAMYVNEFRANGYALVYDPLATAPKWIPADMLQDYAETFTGGSCSAAYTQVTS